MKFSTYDLGRIVRDLITIAEVAMPPHLLTQDRRLRAARELLVSLNISQHRAPSIPADAIERIPYIGEADPADPWTTHIAQMLGVTVPDPEVEAGLRTFMAEEATLADRPAAVEHILRDWLVGHGYIEHNEAFDPYH